MIQPNRTKTLSLRVLIGLVSYVLLLPFNLVHAADPDDPYFSSKGSWGESYDDQWAIKRIGFTKGRKSAWNKVSKSAQPVVVAVVDSGLDWNHKEIDWNRIWHNEDEIPDNGVDDDNNGYVDDVIGWDFWRDTNEPWDRDGHGTFVAGVIAATQDNAAGIAGINPHARIMVLKVMNAFGHTRASHVARAILYAADNGARVINLSLGGKGMSRTAQMAIDYARQKGALVVVAAGNEAINTDTFGPAGAQNVITVGATDHNDKKAVFSNWGTAVDIAAPGVDVLSLRARRTDLLRDIPDVKYEPGDSIIGEDKRYYLAAGTSFAAPMVSAVASLLMANNPNLSDEQVERMLLHSAVDIDAPGVDQFTGYGLLDARAALSADPEFFVEARITGVQTAKVRGKTVVRVLGIADANAFGKAWIEIGAGENPTKWKKVSRTIAEPVKGSALDDLAAGNFRGSKQWVLRLIVGHENGRRREARFNLKLG